MFALEVVSKILMQDSTMIATQIKQDGWLIETNEQYMTCEIRELSVS